jgi:hypothetical protein
VVGTRIFHGLNFHNNSYQESLKMAPFEALCGQQCGTLFNWIEPGEKAIFGLGIVDAAEAMVRRIQDNLMVVKSCQESYANKGRRPLQFEVGDYVYLKVSPMNGVKRFGLKEKLSPHYIGPFLILEKCGNVAYKLKLPPSLTGVHDIFHVSQLKKCLKAPVDVVLPEVAPLETDLTYLEHPIKILDQKVVSQGSRRSSSLSSNGATTSQKKQHGKVSIYSVLAIRIELP